MTGFKDGVKLCILLEILCKKTINYNQNPITIFQKKTNINNAIEFLKKEGVQLVNINSTDIFDENLKIILSLVWKIITKFVFIQDSEGTLKSSLLTFIQVETKPYDVKVLNFTKSFQNGLALSCLVNSLQRDNQKEKTILEQNLVNMSIAKEKAEKGKEGHLELVTNAIHLANEKFQIPPLVDPMLVTESPDESSMVLYLYHFYEKRGKPMTEEMKEIMSRDKSWNRKSLAVIPSQSKETNGVFSTFIKIFKKKEKEGQEKLDVTSKPIGFYLEVPKTLEDLLRNPQALIHFQKYTVEEKGLDFLIELEKLRSTLQDLYIKDSGYIKLYEKMSVDFVEKKMEKFSKDNKKKLFAKEFNFFESMESTLTKFIKEKYITFTYSPVWMEILKTHSGKKAPELRQKSTSFAFWKGDKMKKSSFTEDTAFEDFLKNKNDEISVFKKYSEGELFKGELEFYLDYLKLKELTLEIMVKDKKLNDLFENLYKKLNNLEVDNDLILEINTSSGIAHLTVFEKVEEELKKEFREKFVGFQNSVYWEEMLKSKNRKSSRLVESFTLNQAPIEATTSSSSNEYLGSSKGLEKMVTPRDVDLLEMVAPIETKGEIKGDRKDILPFEMTGIEKIDEIFMSIHSGDFEKFVELIQEQKDIHNIFTRDNLSLIHLAVLSKNYKVCEYLIEKGADVNKLDNRLRTPLHFACAFATREIALLLLGNKSKVNSRDEYGTFPLLIALKKHLFELSSDLMLFGADINFKRENGNTVLHEAIINEDIEMIQWILKRPNIKINTKDSIGYTPLLKSVFCKKVSIFTELYNAGCDIESKDAYGRNIVQVICLEQNTELLKHLASLKVEDLTKFKKLFTDPVQKGKTSLHLAVETRNFKIVGTLTSIFIRLQINMSIKDDQDFTALEIANQLSEKQIVNLENLTQEERKDTESLIKIKQFLAKYIK